MNKEKNAIHAYLDEIGRTKPLTDEQERALADRIAAGDEKAIDRLTAANLAYVVSVARQYAHRGVDLEDLVSEGNIGMLRAATKFKSAFGKRFVTFAAPYIREAMEQAVEQQAGLYRVPRDVRDDKTEKRRSKALSIDAPIGGSPELSLGRVVPDAHAEVPDVWFEEMNLREEFSALLERLDARERGVMRALYGLDGAPMTMAETAMVMDLKRERVRQIRNKALRKIHKMRKP